MKAHRIATFLALVLAGLPLSAQEDVSPLATPVIASGGGGTASQESPFSDRLNPASSAGKQRVTLDTAYYGLVGVDQSGYGNAFNLGLTLPERWGVVTTSASYLGADFKNFDPGNLGQFTVGLSKDLWEDFYVGASLNSTLGSQGWGLDSSLGFIQFIGDWGWLKDFRWGGAMRDMGKAYTTPDDLSLPPVFTPAVGAEFDLVRDNKLTFTLRPDLSFPTFKDINFNLGSTLAFGDIIAVNLAYRFDLRDTVNATANTIPFSFGVGFHFFTDIKTDNDVLGLQERGWNHSEVRVATAATPLSGNVWAVGAGANIPLGAKDTTPPQVKVDTGTRYISPNNDGIQDSLILPITITDERYVMGYTLKVLDANKNLVRTLQGRVTLPEAQGLDQLWNRLTYVKHGVDVPPSLEWNGNTDAGSVAPDGTYSLVVTAWDDNGNTKDWPAGTVVVKNTPPQAAVSAPITEFNPAGPRNKLSIIQRGSSELLWTGTFKDAGGKTVLIRTWKNASPDTFDWDGLDENSKAVPDGVYSYALAATDLAGNTTTAKVGNLIVNTIPTPLDLKVSRTAFSPAGNGVKTMDFQPKAGVTQGLSSWKLEVQDKTGTVRKTFNGTGIVPADMVYDGTDTTGATLPEGEYHAKLTLNYSNGNVPEVISPVFTVKNTPPQAKVTAPYAAFSPGSEEGRGVMVFNQTTSDEDFWTGKLTDGTGKVLRTVRWPGKADATYLWDGRGSDGNILPDGTYQYTVEAVDKAGNTGVSTPVSVTIDTAERTVLLASDRGAFTPVSTGTNNKVRFTPQIKEARGLSSWTLTVQDATGRSLRTWTGAPSAVPGPTVWDGKDDSGTIVTDGVYTALLKTTYGNGTAPSARSNAVTVKNSLPSINVTTDYTLFSPTPDSARPTVTLHQTSSEETEWTGTVSKSGTAVKTFSWKGQVRDAVWDGTDDAGNKVPDGSYRYEVKTTDIADNSVSQAVDNIVVDTRPTPVFLTVGADGFSPNGDGVDDTLTINSRVVLNEGITAWKLEILGDAQAVRKTIEGKGAVPAQFVWDGTNDKGSTVPDGRYSARLSVSYDKGNRPVANSASFILEAGPPQVALELTPQPFSPDNDGYNDELLINIAVKSAAPVSDWSLEILDPEGHRFILFNGTGAPAAQLKWDGRSSTGELVQSASDYTAVFRLKDSLGNSAQITKPLAVDVLVLKDGDRLRIIIPSITFAPNSSDFLKGIDADKVAKNVAVLKRLSEIFTKYQRYKIGIEGHAVMINWNDPAQSKKEQEGELIPLSKARAEAVKNYLVKLGIAEARITSEGIGGARPIVPFSDADNRWKDRRVEFWLDRE
jgi:flagellar hook assembly protein FlgD